ncbi:MAG: hypothetical protein NC111_04315 [Bacteroides sp.]|nr:hypothetical protein [Bacteroides sp.]MCM1413028.1 hypothetical protein [Bacteroides sp.]MCM1471734.1 hypothetical protein [Bacteroides sp.]
MKNTQKLTPVDIGEINTDEPVTHCHNLMAKHIDGRDVLTVAPPIVSLGQGRRVPLATMYDTSGHPHILFHRLSDPAALLVECDATTELEYATGLTVHCAVARRNGFIAMTDRGPLQINRDDEGRWSVTSTIALTHDLLLEPQPAGELSASTTPLTLTGVTFDRTNPDIGSTSLTALGRELSSVYRMISETARSAGLWFQPTLMRYHLTDSSGERIYSSMPMLMSRGGRQLCNEISVDVTKPDTDKLSVPSITLQAEAYRLHLHISEEAARQLTAAGVRSIELTAMPQLHPLDASQLPAWRLVRSTGDSPVLTLTLPGATDHFSSHDAMAARSLHRLSLMMDSEERIVSIIEMPSTGSELSVARTDMTDCDSEIRQTDRLLAQPIATAADAADYSATLMRQTSKPNSFTARAVEANGEVVAWADITPLPTTTVNIAELCSGFSDMPFEGALTVGLADGSTTCLAISGDRTPSEWAPLVSWPDPQATSLTIDLLSADNRRLRGSVNLTAADDRSAACRIDPKLASTPFTPTNELLPQPQTIANSSARRAGAVMACRLTSPLTPLAAVECSHSPIVGLLAAVRSQSTWDFSRCHLYALSADAIHAVAVNASRRSMSATMIDPRGIDRPTAACRCDDCIMALHRGRLLRIAASRVTAHDIPLPTEGAYTDVAWDDTLQRLWMRDSQGNLCIYDTQQGCMATLSSPADIMQLRTEDHTVWLTDSDELYRMDLKATVATTPVRWTVVLTPQPGRRLARVTARISASRFDGYLSVEASDSTITALPPRRLMRLRFAGRCSRPIAVAVDAPHRAFLTLTVTGNASADFSIHSIDLQYT